MERSIGRVAVAVLLFVSAGSAFADPNVISTRCRELEVPLDARHSSARLAGCGEGYPDDLLWHLDRIDQIDPSLDGMFDRRGDGLGSVVYVMDTGVRADHIEFSTAAGGSRVIHGFDAAKSVPVGNSSCRSGNKALGPCYSDWNELVAASHGTSVASIVAGRNVGVAPRASIVSIRVMNERGLATTRTYLDGLEAIIRSAWDPRTPQFTTAVVNISGWVLERLASTSSDGQSIVPFATVEQKMREMVGGVDANGAPTPAGKRFLFVVAANNVDGGCGRNATVDRFPAILGTEVDGIITVGGMTQANAEWSGSCRGGVEVLAPAQGVFSATITATDHYRGRKPNLRSGTSFATPIISGIAARLLAQRPDLTPSQLEATITATPSRTDTADERFAFGKVGYIRPIGPEVAGSEARLSH